MDNHGREECGICSYARICPSNDKANDHVIMTNLMRDVFQEALVCTNDPERMSNLPAGKDSPPVTLAA